MLLFETLSFHFPFQAFEGALQETTITQAKPMHSQLKLLAIIGCGPQVAPWTSIERCMTFRLYEQLTKALKFETR